MSQYPAESFIDRMRQKFFVWRLSREIDDRIIPHLHHKNEWRYPFGTDEEMIALTADLDVKPLLSVIDSHIRNMPNEQGATFRYIFHRDLHKRVSMYKEFARRNARRPWDLRLPRNRAFGGLT